MGGGRRGWFEVGGGARGDVLVLLDSVGPAGHVAQPGARVGHEQLLDQVAARAAEVVRHVAALIERIAPVIEIRLELDGLVSGGLG